MCVHPKTKAKLRTKLKELTSRSNGWGYEKRKEKLTYAIRGWVNYFRLAEMRNYLRETDEWLRSRIRMCIWKCWKRVRTRFKNLQRCGIVKWQAWQWANTRKGYWRTVHSPILTRAISNENLKRAHYPTLTEREFDVRKVLKKLWEWNIFSNFIGDNQRVTNKYPFP